MYSWCYICQPSEVQTMQAVFQERPGVAWKRSSALPMLQMDVCVPNSVPLRIFSITAQAFRTACTGQSAIVHRYLSDILFFESSIIGQNHPHLRVTSFPPAP